ncbi:hypothetical protein [Intrasporangium calvum]|uniref:hypothetical protein n=1 Tax=Intrasporangium calvum TaxID=53358 RepID=UPI000DF631CB|nr:hypothetical protein [Intrasporangium calvum]AXG14701.1 hypothetical protein DN585_15945 [Intrasporangium calvum]
MRKQLTALAVGAAVLTTGLPSAAAAEGPARPLKGWSAPAPDAYGPPVDCPEGTSWRYGQTSTGWFSHLGRVTVTVTHCTYALEGRFDHGATILTAANGDQVWMSYSGTFQLDSLENPTRSDVSLTWTISGGTGRFAGATGDGTGTAVGTISGPDGSTWGTWTGDIAYGTT